MSERKYTDEQIVKGLECCRDFGDFGDCSHCPYENATFADELDCTQKLHTDALALINRQKAEIAVLTTAVDNSTKEFLKLHDEYQDQKAEIEELEYDRKLIFDEGKVWQKRANDLQIELDAMRGAANSYKMHYENAKAEAIKEFAVRLQKSYYDLPTMSDEEGEYDYVCMEALDEFIDNLVAEMTEGK